mmetsp:Transcript_14804/g.26747  ORF Transcript_14804/g.26747 Transcript_14804/m.26747 type:complete len:184 (+) Transcript_14804:1232-1783(+)
MLWSVRDFENWKILFCHRVDQEEGDWSAVFRMHEEQGGARGVFYCIYRAEWSAKTHSPQQDIIYSDGNYDGHGDGNDDAQQWMEYHKGMWGMRNGKSFGDVVGSISSTDMLGMYRGGDATGHGGEVSRRCAFKKPKDRSTHIGSLSDNWGNPMSPTYEERKECDCTRPRHARSIFPHIGRNPP